MTIQTVENKEETTIHVAYMQSTKVCLKSQLIVNFDHCHIPRNTFSRANIIIVLHNKVINKHFLKTSSGRFGVHEEDLVRKTVLRS